MSRPSKLVALVAVLALAGAAMTACSQTGTSSTPGSEQIQKNTDANVQKLDQAISTAQAKVSEVASSSACSAAESMGVTVNKHLQAMNEQLTVAMNAHGTAKAQAVKNAAASFTQLIAQIDAAAAKAPAGSPQQAALAELSTKLKDIQSSLSSAVTGTQ